MENEIIMYNKLKKFKSFGNDIIIDNWAKITNPQLLQLGSHIAIDMGVYISVGGEIHDYVHIAPHVCVIGGKNATLVIEDFGNVGAGSKLVVISDDFKNGLVNPIVPLKHKNLIGNKITMRKFSLVGVNSVVLPNVEMGEGSVLAANSLLKCSTEPWTIYAGNPAKPIGIRNKEWILKSAKELGY
jgi:acetyltransferase-like isoleucine patch superfamily enzyme